jgi:predicted dehydrogenase
MTMKHCGTEPTRREFLGVAGVSLVSAASVLASASNARPTKRQKRTVIRLAVVGGHFGAQHYWHEHPNCVVTAVSDLLEDRRQSLSEAYQCDRVYPSLEVMLDKAADTFDAVAIFTDAPSHPKHAIACMEAGKHVTSAVPAAMSLEDARKLRETKEKTGLIYMMHESCCYRQPTIAARELYQAGEFGRLAYSEVEYYHPGIGARANTLTRWQGLQSWRYGLPPMLYPTHAVGLLVGLTGERLVKVSCLGQRVGKTFPEPGQTRWNNPFDNEMALGVTDKGNICRFNVCWQLAAEGVRAQWIGQKLSCYMGDSAGRLPSIYKAGSEGEIWEVPQYWKTERLPEAMRHDSGHDGSSTFLSAEFIDALVEEREPSVNLYEALAMTIPGIIAHESAISGGRQLEVPGFDRSAGSGKA